MNHFSLITFEEAVEGPEVNSASRAVDLGVLSLMRTGNGRLEGPLKATEVGTADGALSSSYLF